MFHPQLCADPGSSLLIGVLLNKVKAILRISILVGRMFFFIFETNVTAVLVTLYQSYQFTFIYWFFFLFYLVKPK